MSERYLLGTDAAGIERLRVLDVVYGATTRALLVSARLRPPMRAADIGCGVGATTAALSEITGDNVCGVDEAETLVAEARKAGGGRFLVGDAYAPPLPAASFDFVYARCLLSHLREPLRALTAMAALARTGGVVCVEDIDCGGVFAHPETPALMRHQELYQKIIRLHGGDPLMGRKLPRLLRLAGLGDVRYQIVRPRQPADAIKQLYPLTLACLKPAIVAAGLATAAALDALVAELHAFTDDPAVVLPATPMVQVWARKP